MMRNRTVVVAVLSLCLIIPAAVRLSFSLVLVVDIMYLMLAITGIRKLVSRFLSGPLARVAELCYSVLAAVFFECCLAVFSPILDSLLYMYVLLASVSAYLLLYPEYDIGSEPATGLLKSSFLKSLQFCCYILLFGLFRELLGMGCISFPSRTGIYQIPLFSFLGHDLFRFAASTGGSLIFMGIIVATGRFMRKCMEIARRIQK